MSGTITSQAGVVTFDYATWSALFPDLATNTSDAQAALYFDQAGDYLNNTPLSPVQNLTKRARLLNLLTAHIAQLMLPVSAGGNGAGTVGRVASASEGSTSIGLDMGSQSVSAAWFMQTQYGAMFWQATAYLRQMRFVPGRSPRPRIWP
ncbi:DUF4054 domain-containing protein [Gluconobacter sphaericus]|uniref:DUF4054 domain-containing protein n=1 Tax=Gluconobacter sphaericus NBRC 12467 TaxID=1307951 RepID=A0AA37SJI4_9PROT|nr:DUF4054 domain-containing protein [Gluconobacter sphaericus]MBF0885535.1 DUF4054 domain-containing protein [Gluconobacter sphaericus]GBR56493.1 hypothetical protein AA12467_2639 [Gluconobacter sphaericus NBRC 12467]GEB42773.1 hypothetical protein GSP01_15550 [Gluconobacter sphaericus NBRC 12467]GLQ84749.1 hypothetical protein GCM10007872_16570 [Gluconobacter sphaericus NBRC 12467]GLQ85096.1 hypothetical protein GCM10007872_20040 [Gluconobacter sphaericus NBRC 12467]